MTMDDDHIVLAAEYVLGTLDAAEMARAEELMRAQPEFAALVGEWERRLGELQAMVDPVEPPADMFARIKARLPVAAVAAAVVETPVTSGARAPSPPASDTIDLDALGAAIGVRPEVEAPPVVAVATPEAIDGQLPPPQRVDLRAPSQVVTLTNRVRRWRGAATMFGALAAALVALIVTAAVRPDALPAPLRPKPQVVEVVKTVEKPAPAPSRFVAVLQQGGTSPAFILTVDVASRMMTMRRVAADPQAGKSYELWLVSDKFPAPRSLGVVGAGEFTSGPKLASFEPDTINTATFAVTLEPEGGSPSGAPTGPVLWSGKLVEAVPP